MNELLLPLGHLMVFDAIYQHRNVSVAARLLAVPQPTLSRWLGQLRQHFDDPLFVRTRSGMEPTPFAEQQIGRASCRESVCRYGVDLGGRRIIKTNNE